MVRREVKKVKGKQAVEIVVPTPKQEQIEGQSGTGNIPKPPTDAEKKAMKEKLRAELFRAL